MRTALLVLAFNQPDVLRWALPVYYAAGFDVYVHLDGKSDKGVYLDALGNLANECKFLPDRIKIFWGGFSMVQAELALIFHAMNAGDYGRFILISDDTLPIKAPVELRNFAGEAFEHISLRHLELEDPFYRRYREFYFFDHPVSSLLGRPIEDAFVDDKFIEIIGDLGAIRASGKVNIPIYYGSQWWSLTRGSMEKVLQVLESRPNLIRSFQFTAVPDEMMLQTIVGNFVERSKIRNGPVFVDWSKSPKPFVFQEREEFMSHSREYAFARKFSTSTNLGEEWTRGLLMRREPEKVRQN